MRTPLTEVTYETVETVTLTVSQMLALTSALFDAANWNEQKGWVQSAEAIRKLRGVIEEQTDDLINEADRKCTEWLKARDEERRWKREEEAAEAYIARMEMEDDQHFIEADNCDDGQGPREEFTTGKSELET